MKIFVSRRSIKEAPAHENAVTSLRGEVKTSINGVVFYYYQSQGGTFVILTAYLENSGPDDGDDGEGGPSLSLPVGVPPADCISDVCLEAHVHAQALSAWNDYVKLSARTWLRVLSGMLFRNSVETVELARCGVLDGGHRIARTTRFLGDFEIQVVGRDLFSHDYEAFRTLTEPRPISAAQIWIDSDFECRRDLLASRQARLFQTHRVCRYELQTDTLRKLPDSDFGAGDIVMFFDLHMFQLLTGMWMFGIELGRRQDRGDLLAYQQYATGPADDRLTVAVDRPPTARLRAVLRRRNHLGHGL